MHAKFVFLHLHVAFVGPDFNALSTQRVCSTSESAYSVPFLGCFFFFFFFFFLHEM